MRDRLGRGAHRGPKRRAHRRLRHALAAGRPVSRRADPHGDRRARPAGPLLLRRGRRRSLGERQRRTDLGADLRLAADRLDRRDRRRALPNPTSLYVGSGEADMRSDISYGNGMYRSTDGGKSWTHIGLTDTRQIGRILVDPHDPDLVFVAALGHAYGPNPERGVFRSTDGGRTWKAVLFKDDDTGAIDLAFDPDDSKTILAALWQTRRPPWNVYPPSNGPGSGLYRSDDGGDTWTPGRRTGFPRRGSGGSASRSRRPIAAPRVRDRRREGGRPLRLRGRRRQLEAVHLRPAHLGARLVLRRRDRRPEGRRTSSTPATRRCTARPTAARRSSRSRARRAATTTTSSGSTLTTRAA